MRSHRTTRQVTLPTVVTALVLALSACVGDPAGEASESTATAPDPSSTPPGSSTSAPAATSTTDVPAEQVVGTVVRFTSERTSVDVTIGEDSPATGDFLSMLPLELGVEEFSGAEKIAYLPHELAHDGTAGSDPEDGDLIYYTPWGNLGFYYDASGIGYSDATLHLGTYQATPDQLALLEGEQVTVAVVP